MTSINKLPIPLHKYGYPASQLSMILSQLGITEADFSKAFGVNTCTMSDTGEIIYYECDVENALHILNHKLGRGQLWD